MGERGGYVGERGEGLAISFPPLQQNFCQKYSGSSSAIPYYETSTNFGESIRLAFQEIMARPLINEYVVSGTIDVMLSTFHPSLSFRSRLPQNKNRIYLCWRYDSMQ